MATFMNETNTIYLRFTPTRECPRVSDGHHCWPVIEVNHTASFPCPLEWRENIEQAIRGEFVPNFGHRDGIKPLEPDNMSKMYKRCNSDGEWEPTDFRECIIKKEEVADELKNEDSGLQTDDILENDDGGSSLGLGGYFVASSDCNDPGVECCLGRKALSYNNILNITSFILRFGMF